MRFSIVFFITIFLVGCATHGPRYGAKLISQVYEPERSGKIRLYWNELATQAQAREKAKELMMSFCGQKLPYIISIEQESKYTGSTTEKLIYKKQFQEKLGLPHADIDETYAHYKDIPVIKFVCREKESKEQKSASRSAVEQSESVPK